MIPERIGTIGRMQGVNPSRMPKPKKLATITQKLPARSKSPTAALSDFGGTRRAADEEGDSATCVPTEAAGSLRLHPGAAATAPGFQAASVRSKLRLLGG